MDVRTRSYNATWKRPKKVQFLHTKQSAEEVCLCGCVEFKCELFFLFIWRRKKDYLIRVHLAAFTRIRIDPDIRMSQLRIGLPSTRKRLKCTLSGAICYAIRSCSKTISKVDHPDVPVLFGQGKRGIRISGCHCACALGFPSTWKRFFFFFPQASKLSFALFLSCNC